MTVREWYQAALQYNYYSLILLIEFLVYEKKTIQLEDSEQALNFYMQERFKTKMNTCLLEYQTKLKSER
ncbi:hypothetical protein ABE197_04650 [Bacillus subtilis]|uniref:hypothetical protein n=1 Tax=Bacillus sp. LBG-1-113 TaxID=2886094 RepID=UPI001E60B6CB|nr:hypothetical protein [Bacillus sp. LBG-1-113]MCC2931628.1 hypothetical protein [Bacillus sp. LBG-1-113]